MHTLIELEAKFLKYEDDKTFNTNATFDNADGLMFLCPKCFDMNNGRIGTHIVICWYEDKVPESLNPNPGRWTPSGTGLNDLTFIPGVKHTAVSVQIMGGCNWHGFVKNGNVE